MEVRGWIGVSVDSWKSLSPRESFPDVNEPASFDVQETGNKSGLLHTIELFGFDNVGNRDLCLTLTS